MKKILPKHITVDDLPPQVAEIVERMQILLDESTDEHKRNADNATECIHQMNKTMGLCSEAHIAVEDAKAGLKSYATKRELYLALGIVALAFYCMGYWAHG